MLLSILTNCTVQVSPLNDHIDILRCYRCRCPFGVEFSGCLLVSWSSSVCCLCCRCLIRVFGSSLVLVLVVFCSRFLWRCSPGRRLVKVAWSSLGLLSPSNQAILKTTSSPCLALSLSSCVIKYGTKAVPLNSAFGLSSSLNRRLYNCNPP